MSFPIALQLFSVRDEAEKDLRGTLAKVKQFGYDGVEFAGLYGNSAAEIKAMCSEIGLVPLSAHIPYEQMLADPQGVFAAYAEIGCKYIAVPYLSEEYRPGSELFPDVIKNIELLGKIAAGFGLTLLYHNHEFEFIKLGGKYALDVLYEKIPADYLQTELDTCWISLCGESPADYLIKYKGRSPLVHLKDFCGKKSVKAHDGKPPKRPRSLEFCPIGSGSQDFPAILDAAKQAGTEWLVVEQDSTSMGLTAMQSAEKSLEYLRTINN